MGKKTLVALSWLLAMVSFNNMAVSAEQEILIGFVAPLSEPRTQSALAAARMAVDEANQRAPQIGNRKVRFTLLPQDDKADPRVAPIVAQYLRDSGVAGVIGHWTTACSIAAAPVYANAGIPQISPASTAHIFTQQNVPTTFRIMGHDEISADYIGRYVVTDLHATRILVIDDGTAFGMGLADQFTAAVLRNNGSILKRLSISSKTSDFNAPLSTAKDLQADLIFFSARVNQSGELARNMKRLDIKAILLATGGTVSRMFLSIAGNAAEGTLSIEPGPAATHLPGWKIFQKNFQGNSSTDVSPFTLFAYDATQVLLAAIRQADSLTPGKITAALHQIRFKGLTGAIAFDEAGNLMQPAYTLYRVTNGEWQAIKTFGGTRN